jgi:hypothetical protein
MTTAGAHYRHSRSESVQTFNTVTAASTTRSCQATPHEAFVRFLSTIQTQSAPALFEMYLHSGHLRISADILETFSYNRSRYRSSATRTS